MNELFTAVASGRAVSEYSSKVYMYGIYLANGGTPSGYEAMDDDDLDMMYVSYSAHEAHRHNRWMEGLVKIVKALFGDRS